MKWHALGFLLCAATLLWVLFLFFRPDTGVDKTREPITALAPQDSPAARTFDLVIEQNRLVSPAPRLQVNVGDEVVIHVVADSRDEFHLHGYDLLLDLEPGETATLRFTADRAGRFEYELERLHIHLGALEVYP